VNAPIPVRRAIARMRPYHPPLEGRTGKVRLDFNENTLGPSLLVRKALRGLSSEAISMYPEQETVRREMAACFHVRPEQLLLTNGTDEALHLIVDTFVEGRTTVLLVEPTFAMYRFYSELAGARIKSLQYGANLEFPVAQVLASVRSQPRAIFIANPNNPTGTLLRTRDLRRIIEASRKTLVVVDEAYCEYSGVTVLPWIRRYKNLVVTRTFSKAAGLAGLRLGSMFAHSEIAACLRKAQSPYPVNAATLAAARAVIRDSRHLQRSLREFRRSRPELERGLERLGVRIFPSAANFILVDLGDRAKEVVARLGGKGILIRDRSNDFEGQGYARITVGSLRETRRLLDELKEIL
jgi:histidinol-phosphate aminotransferase